MCMLILRLTYTLLISQYDTLNHSTNKIPSPLQVDVILGIRNLMGAIDKVIPLMKLEF